MFYQHLQNSQRYFKKGDWWSWKMCNLRDFINKKSPRPLSPQRLMQEYCLVEGVWGGGVNMERRIDQEKSFRRKHGTHFRIPASSLPCCVPERDRVQCEGRGAVLGTIRWWRRIKKQKCKDSNKKIKKTFCTKHIHPRSVLSLRACLSSSGWTVTVSGWGSGWR